ncbi:MAG TPA: gamma-glutamylcyclotransferase family protein [Tissierellaceae bacterium]|nr:gamma-glutamylcyclotransferase family protein [Tissierellaceae bacterium]
MLYFAYASNLSKDYMLSRCEDAIPIKKVVLKGYKLVFNQLADIVKEDGKVTMGAIYMISKEELQQLDILEGYPDLYDRMIVEVEDDRGNKYDVTAYMMVDKDLQSPPNHYYQTLLNGYKDWDLPLKCLEEALEISKKEKDI